MKLIILVIAFSFVFTACSLDSASPEKKSTIKYAPISVELTVKKMSEHVYFVPGQSGTATEHEGFISNAGFIITDDGVVVFDALGTPSLAWTMLQEIKKITSKPIIKVISSHYHADHIYGLQVFKEAGAEIIAPAGVSNYIGSNAAVERLEERRFSLEPWVNDNTLVVSPDVIIDKQTTLKIGGLTFEIDYLGAAHSDGDLSLYIVEDKVLFSGDIIFEGRIPYVGDADTKLWLESIKKMESAKLSVLIPGHGAVANDPNSTLALTRDYLTFLRQVMSEAVDDLTEFKEAYDDTDWSEFEDIPAFGLANRVNAYTVFLAMEKESLE